VQRCCIVLVTKQSDIAHSQPSMARPEEHLACAMDIWVTEKLTFLLPTWVAFRVDPSSSDVLLHITWSPYPKYLSSYQTRYYLLRGDTLFSPVARQIRQYYDRSYRPAITLTQMLPDILNAINFEVLSTSAFAQHWLDTLLETGRSDPRYNSSSGRYPIAEWPGGGILRAVQIEPHWWDDQIRLTHIVKTASTGYQGDVPVPIYAYNEQIGIASIPSRIATRLSDCSRSESSTFQSGASASNSLPSIHPTETLEEWSSVNPGTLIEIKASESQLFAIRQHDSSIRYTTSEN
jgi:hypothetical protein